MGSSKSLKRGLDASSTTSWVFPELVLPDDEDTPAHGFQLFLVKPVPFHVSLELPPPERGVCLWQREVVFGAAVPEAAVNEDGQPVPGVDEIWATGEFGANQLPSKQCRENQL